MKMIKVPNSEKEFENVCSVPNLVYAGSYFTYRQLIFHNTENPDLFWTEEFDGTFDYDGLYK